MTPKRKRVLLSGYYGYANAGDEAVCAAVLQALRTHGGDPDVTVLSGDPAATERIHGVKAVPRGELLRALKTSDALFQGGGSLLQDATSAASVYYYLWVLGAAIALRRPVFLYAQGIGPLRRRSTRAAVKAVLNRVGAITVRDAGSKDLLEAIGVRRAVVQTADPVWALNPAADERARSLWTERGLPDRGRTVGLALRAWPSAPGLADAAARAASTLRERGMDVVLYPMQRPADEDFADAVNARMSHPAPVISDVARPEDLMALAGRMEFLIGMRLHALIFAAARGVPLLGLSYDPKVDALLAQIGGIPSLDVSGLEPEALLALFETAWENRDAGAARVRAAAERLQETALDTARLAVEFLR
jgi:polysaccharide pyruvyl transferase CsaB